MHQTRAEVSKRIPIERKGTQYVARPFGSLQNSVPVVIALREMLNLAHTRKEVQHIINKKILKLNGREVKDYREPIYLFNILEAGKNYILSLTENNRFKFDETKSSSQRLCKVIGKKVLKGKKIQINLHDGTNVLSSEKISVGDSVYLDSKGKIAKHVSVEKGKTCFIIAGKYTGSSAKIESIEGNYVQISITEKKISTWINKSNLIVQ